MDMSLENHYIVMPCHPGDKHSQRCRLGPDDIKTLNLNIGHPLWITSQEIEYLCRVWIRTDLCNKFVQFDKKVFRKARSLSDETAFKSSSKKLGPYKSKENGGDGWISFTPVLDPVPNIEWLNVDIVVRDFSDVPVLKSKCKDDMCKLFKESFNTCLVGRDCTIDVENHLSGKMTGISSLVVSEIQPDCDVGLITSETALNITHVMSKERATQKSQRTDFILGGLETPAQMLRDLIELPARYSENFHQLGIEAPKGVLLRGPPGCGKTSLVRAICRECDTHLIVVNAPEVFGSRPGESEDNLRKLFNKASLLSQEGPCVLFIDEIDALCPKRGKSGRNPENRLVSQLLLLMDDLPSDGHLVIIGATNRPNAIDPALRRPGRFDREVFIGIPNLAQRRSVLEVNTRNIPLDDDIDLDYLADATNGYSGADLVSLCHEASYSSLTRLAKGEGNDVKVTMKEFRQALCKITPSSQRGAEALVDSAPVYWDDIGGYDDVKVKIQQAVEWPIKHPEAFTRLGLPRPKGILLYGPPGCSKTMMVRAAATSCNVTFLCLSGAQLYSPFVGDSEKAVSEVFQRARAGAPSIVFFDEIDSIIGKRSEGNSGRGAQERVLSTLLNEMDGVGIRLEDKQGSHSREMALEGGGSRSQPQSSQTDKVNNSDVLLVAATNRPDLLDDALMRPGRIDRVVYVPPPDEQTRLDILKVHTRNTPTEDLDLSHLANLTEGYTGADLENLCREAAMLALTEDGIQAKNVSGKYFKLAYNATAPTVGPDLLKQYANYQKSRLS